MAEGETSFSKLIDYIAQNLSNPKYGDINNKIF